MLKVAFNHTLPLNCPGFKINSVPTPPTPTETLTEKLHKVPTTSLDKLHPHKTESRPYAEYVEEGLWKSRVTFQKDYSHTALNFKQQAKTAESQESSPKDLDTVCEEELKRRFPNYRVIHGVKAFLKNHFPFLTKLFLGKMTDLTQQEVDRYKKQIAFSACDRDDLICTPTIEDPTLRSELNLQDDSILQTQHHFAKNSPLNGRTFIRDGKRIHLSQGIACSSDRTVENTKNMRHIQSKNSQSICYTGCPDSERKALEQASYIFFNELKTHKKGLTQTTDEQGNVVYQLDYVLNSMLSGPWIWSWESPLCTYPERKYLDDEIKALSSLKQKGVVTLEDPHSPGVTYKVKFNPILFSRSLNAFHRFEQWVPPFVVGQSYALQVSDRGFTEFKTLVEQKLQSRYDLSRQQIDQITSTLKQLEQNVDQNQLRPEEEILLRDYLCIMLNLPVVKHCKSSLDRTSIAVALPSALQQWLDLKLPLPNDLRTLLQDWRFKELFLANWMAGHQITRYMCNRKGTVAKEKLKTKKLGFTLNHGIAQNDAILRLVPARYLTDYSPNTRRFAYVCYSLASIPIFLFAYLPLTFMTLLWKVACILNRGRNPAGLGRGEFTIPAIILRLFFNFMAIFPTKILNETSSQVGARQLVMVKKQH